MGRLDFLHGRCLSLFRRIAFIGVLAILVVAILTAVDIGLRWFGTGFVLGFNEILAMVIAVAIAATFPAGAAGRVNLAIDLFAARLGKRAVRWLHVAGALLMLVLYLILVWSLEGAAEELFRRNASTMILRLPQAPFLWGVVGFLALAVIAQFIVFLVTLRDALAGIDVENSTRPTNASAGTRSPSSRESPRARLLLLAAVCLIAAAFAAFGIGASIAPLSAIAHSAPVGAAVVLFLIMWALVFLLVPIAAAMGLVGVVGTALIVGLKPALAVLGTVVVEYVTSDQLAVLPLFLMMGSFAAVAGLSGDIYNLAHVVFGHRRGGLALATIGGCAGFGALTGSSLATAATIGQVALPEMRARGYAPGLATGCIAAGGTLGQLVPPSTALILYALLTEELIGRLFVGAVVPAIIAVILYCVTISLIVRLDSGAAPPASRGPGWAEIWAAVRRAWGVLLLFAVVIGGVYGGVFTATEAAAVGAGGAFLFALARGKLARGALLQVVGETTATTAMLYVMFFGAVTFSYFMGLSSLPDQLTLFFESLHLAPVAIIALLLVAFTILGCIMDPFAVMVITVPILAPFIVGLGYSLVWWGVVMVIVVETGMITPPFGINVFILKSLVGSDVPSSIVFRGVAPFVIADLIKLALIVIFPALVMWLPSTM